MVTAFPESVPCGFQIKKEGIPQIGHRRNKNTLFYDLCLPGLNTFIIKGNGTRSEIDPGIVLNI